jgi:RNA polymerase sigma-70 factor, ECF subfamily
MEAREGPGFVSEPSVPDQLWRQLLTEQIRLHSRLFLRLAWGVLHDSHAAQDVCQLALLKAWQQRDRMHNAVRTKAWLARVVVNESLQLMRRRKLEQRVHSEIGQMAEHADGSSTSPVLRSMLEEALVSLPEPVRLVVVLRIMDGLSGNEVSELLGCSPSEVSRRLHAGLERLRGLLVDVQVK